MSLQRLTAAANNAVDLAFGWDPSEPVATRPLWMQRVSGTYNFFYFHDGNKNVSELVSYQAARGVPAHYEYAPFGALTAATTNTAFTTFNVAATNPFRFSSEYVDDVLGLVYYNYRHYEPMAGRWLRRDPIGEFLGENLMALLRNHCTGHVDKYGLCCCGDCQIKKISVEGPLILGFRFLTETQKDFGTISFESLIEGFSEKTIDGFIKKHSDSLIKSIYDAGKTILDQKAKWEIIANFSVSTGFVMQPQLEVATRLSCQKRDCARKWQLFGIGVGSCSWQPWKKQNQIQSKWVSPPKDTLLDTQFDIFEAVRDPGSVFSKVREGLANIMNSVDSDEYRNADIAEFKSAIGCEYVDDLD